MHNITLALDGVWKVLVIGLLLGAGLPALFAVGIKAMAAGAGGDAEVNRATPNPLGRAVAIICFAVVIAVAAVGITYIVASGFGKTISFDHIYPRIVDK